MHHATRIPLVTPSAVSNMSMPKSLLDAHLSLHLMNHDLLMKICNFCLERGNFLREIEHSVLVLGPSGVARISSIFSLHCIA